MAIRRPGTRRALLYPIISNPWQHNGTWVLGASGWVNTPTLGSELLTDPGLETWTSATNLTNWTEVVAGTSTVNQETSVIHGGSNAARLDIDAGVSQAAINQGVAVVGTWYQGFAWAKVNDATGSPLFQLQFGGAVVTRTLTTSYVQHFNIGRASSAAVFQLNRSSASGSKSIYLDDASWKALTTNHLFVVRTGNTASARATLTTGAPAGVVAKLNSISAPTDGIFGYHDGTNAVMLKLVAGTYTQLVSTAATYVAGALIELRNPSGDIWQIFYNGTQRGTNQTVSDATVTPNTLAGGFSAYLGNTLTDLRTS